MKLPKRTVLGETSPQSEDVAFNQSNNSRHSDKKSFVSSLFLLTEATSASSKTLLQFVPSTALAKKNGSPCSDGN